MEAFPEGPSHFDSNLNFGGRAGKSSVLGFAWGFESRTFYRGFQGLGMFRVCMGFRDIDSHTHARQARLEGCYGDMCAMT